MAKSPIKPNKNVIHRGYTIRVVNKNTYDVMCKEQGHKGFFIRVSSFIYAQKLINLLIGGMLVESDFRLANDKGETKGLGIDNEN